MADEYMEFDAAEVVSTERIIPRFVNQSLAPNPSLANKWVTEAFHEYIYVEEVKRTFSDGKTDTVRVEQKCQPTAVKYVYQVNSKGERDGMFIAFLEDGRVHWITNYKNGKSVEHHCVVQEAADAIELWNINLNNPLIFWRCRETPQNGLAIDTAFRDGKPTDQEVYLRKDGQDVWREKVPNSSREVAVRRADTHTPIPPTEAK